MNVLITKEVESRYGRRVGRFRTGFVSFPRLFPNAEDDRNEHSCSDQQAEPW